MNETGTNQPTQTDAVAADSVSVDQGTPETMQTVTTFDTEKGSISIVHDITLGDLLISTLLAAILIFRVLDRVIRG